MLVKRERTPPFYSKVNTRHHIFECENLQTLWKNISNYMYIGFDVRWKHLIFCFYSVQNNTTFLYNLLLSFVVLKIYKYKMYCRLEKIDESYEGILFHLKSCLQDCSIILSVSENKTYSSFFKKAKYQDRRISIWYFMYLLHSISLLCNLLTYIFSCCQIKDKKLIYIVVQYMTECYI